MKSRQNLAMNLRRLRVERGLSQERLAADSGVDRAFVGGIERQTENPTIDVLDKLAQTLLVEASELLVTVDANEEPARLRAGRKRKA